MLHDCSNRFETLLTFVARHPVAAFVAGGMVIKKEAGCRSIMVERKRRAVQVVLAGLVAANRWVACHRQQLVVTGAPSVVHETKP